MATKEARREVKGLIEGLESRVHRGPPIAGTEIHSVRDLLRRHEFSPCSDYFARLGQIETCLGGRTRIVAAPTKRNYGGQAAGHHMQVQSIFDHVILSTCYSGEFNCKRGKIKISHRFNQEGRIDFVELKYLRSLHSPLDGETRKLVLVKNYQTMRKDWHEAEAAVLRILPQELIFLFEDIFRCPKGDVLAWLLNIGHGIVDDLLNALSSGEVTAGPASEGSQTNGNSSQIPLSELSDDQVAIPILEKASGLESAIEEINEGEVVVRYLRKGV
ncbi:MAG: hypothetical protein C5B50_18505 [Verrucomicrobia bacterium]|nr:MAG: hypothetical protein C5B50_18505 [Verrucomicrobiota bacterium]